MSRHLHGKERRLYLIRLASCLFALSMCLILMGPEAGAEDKRSGVVKPVVTTIKPSEASRSPMIIDYHFPTKYSAPFGIAVAPDGRIWVTESNENTLAVFDPRTNELKEYRIPSTTGLPKIDWEYDTRNKTMPERTINVYSVGSPGNIIVDKKGIVWFVLLLGNSIVRFDPEKEEFIELPVPTADARPYDLAVDSKGGIWYVQKNAGKLGYMNFETKRSFEIDLGKESHMMGIAIDKDDQIWFSNVGGNYIGRYSPETKKIKSYPITVPLSQPGMMRFDKDGMLWICNLRSRQLGVLMTDRGIYSVVDLPGYNTVPQALVPGDDNKIWMVDSMTNKIGYFNSITLKWRVFEIPTPNSQSLMIVKDKTGNLWFTQNDRNANKISKLVVSTVPEEMGNDVGANVAGVAQSSENMGNLYIIIGIFAIVVLAGIAFIFRSRKR
ncbi:hypothetical protein MNBD_NITROSPINAE02-1161 [hydrothermal vent metagenome]|uniref:SMP-30/Gluconolactonase/LRE-like region domain-containing protein n=1 Tax=hydrothermal vent metagenome TaxID=652676 RepID=A0A3B1D9V3_9ZZZZ